MLVMSDPESALTDPSGQAETVRVAEVAAVDVTPGSLYVGYGAVTARAVAGPVAERDPRRRAYLRHVVVMAALFVCVGVAAIVVGLALFG